MAVIEADDKPPDRKEVERWLRSFSAEGSTRANREEANRLTVLHEHKVNAAAEAAELFRSGKLQLRFDKCESSESESSSYS